MKPETNTNSTGIPGNPTVQSAEDWLEMHGDQLFQFALSRVGDPDLAEEMLQNTLFKAIRGIQQFRGAASIRTWLFQILKNEIGQYFRQKARQAVRLVGEFDLDSGPSMTRLLSAEVDNAIFQCQLEREEFVERFRQCADELPPHFLAAFMLRISNEHESLKELAAELEISSANLAVRLFRARLLLRHCLEESWLQQETD